VAGILCLAPGEPYSRVTGVADYSEEMAASFWQSGAANLPAESEEPGATELPEAVLKQRHGTHRFAERNTR